MKKLAVVASVVAVLVLAGCGANAEKSQTTQFRRPSVRKPMMLTQQR